jgi:hypothetical protein
LEKRLKAILDTACKKLGVARVTAASTHSREYSNDNNYLVIDFTAFRAYNRPIVPPKALNGAALEDELKRILAQAFQILGDDRVKEIIAASAPPGDGAHVEMGMAVTGQKNSLSDAGIELQNDETFATRLARMKLKERREALKKHYSKFTPWVKARSDNPKPNEYLKWLDDNFLDRLDIGLLYGDMEHIDHEAFLKLKNWRASTNPEIMAAISKFGLPTKQGSYDPESAVKEAPTSREVRDAFLRGDPDAPILERKFARARYHTLG